MVDASFDIGRAVLHAADEFALDIAPPVLVINDINREMKEMARSVFWNPEETPEMPPGDFGSIVLFAPKQKDESRGLIAQSLARMKKGVVIVAAHNEAGGKTLKKTLVEFGVPVSDHSKHKCRVVWTDAPERAAKIMIESALKRGGPQRREQDGLWSLPGLFSWDRLDTGTDALLHHLPFSLKGRGADFGCGIGVIGARLLARYKDIEKIYCLDRDARALECCAKNLEKFGGRFDVRRTDLTKDISLPPLDFIISNPPFHIGKKQAVSIGKTFILNAAKNLKPGGIFVFVANTHLPYEKTVQENFFFSRILSEEHGFKIIEALK